MRSFLLALPVVLASLGGCKKHVIDCGDVADNMIVVTRDVIAKTGNPPPKKDVLVAECQQHNLAPKEKVCMAHAKDVESLAKCVGKRAQTPRDKSGMDGMDTAPTPQMDLDKLPPGHPQVTHPMDRPPEPANGSGSAAATAGSAAPK